MTRINDSGNAINKNNEPNFGYDFKAHLREVFINQNKYSVKEVAAKMGISADTLYSYFEDDRVNFPADRVFDYMRATGDLTFLHFCARKLGLVISKNEGAWGKLAAQVSAMQLNFCGDKK